MLFIEPYFITAVAACISGANLRRKNSINGMAMKKQIALVLAVGALLPASRVLADTTIANFTFETSVPTTAGPFNAEVGTGTISGSHAGASVYSSPAGNGSAHSYSSTLWATGDYYQLHFSTVGLSGVYLNFDQVSSGTGPGKFLLEYSTDGTTFTPVTGTDYTVLANTTPNAWSSGTHLTTTTFNNDLTGITAINNKSDVYIRFVDDSTTSANGGTVATGGTDRMDNIVVVVPEPSTYALLGTGLASLLFFRRKK